MLTLIIETCTERGAVALLDQNRIFFNEALPCGYNQSQYLMPKIEAAFSAAGLRPKEIDLIGAGIGPGSYTGMRVGAAVAKAIAYACRIPLAGVCTLEAFLPLGVDAPCEYAALIDAKIGGCYLLKGYWTGEQAENSSKPALVPLEYFDRAVSKSALLVTPHQSGLQKKIDTLYPGNGWRWMEAAPCPLRMAARAREKFLQGAASKEGKLPLLYLRETEAEYKKNHPCS